MNVARVYKRLFPFIASEAEDLTGIGKDRGEIGFGTAPKFTGVPGKNVPVNITNATAWRPILSSVSSNTLGEEVPHRVRIEFFEQQVIDEAQFENGTVLSGVRWRQVIFDEPAVNFVYITGLPVPVSEENGNPFGLRIITEGRQDPSLSIIDWEWARFNNDVTEDVLWRINETPRAVYDATDIVRPGLRRGVGK